jgi:aminoglycoside phosphotransferase (APT) family kinase protein
MTISTRQLQQIAQVIYPQGKLNHSQTLTGGISAQTIRLDIGLPDNQFQQIVLRQHGEVDRRLNPNIARDEFRLLTVLTDAGLPVPKPIYIDDSPTITDIPYIVIEFIEHEPFDETSITVQQIHQTARALCDIHQVNLPSHDLSFLPDLTDAIQSRLSQPLALKTKHIQEALIHALPRLHLNDKVLLHGDYWLGNILWRDRNMVAVIDWEDAILGDPLSDFGKSRLELLWAGGVDAMNTYTDHYFAVMSHLDPISLPFWDLYGALWLSDFTSWFDDADKIATMQRQYEWFVDSAIRQLS